MLNVAKVALLVLLMGGLITGAFGAGYAQALVGSSSSPLNQVQRSIPLPGASRATVPQEFQLLEEVWNILNQDFVDAKKLDPEKLGRGALEGLINALGDNHTSYIEADDYRAEQSGIRGIYEGIGASVMMVEGVLTVVAPLAGSPAEQAGLRAGDKILEINGEGTQGVNLSEAVSRVKGPRGSNVRLLVQHADGSRPVLIEVTRAEIRTSSVVLRMLPEGVAHIRIIQFSQRTGSELRDALAEAKAANAKGIVLDLRNNPGGLLDTTVDATGQFLDGGIAGYQVDRDGKREELRVPGRRDVTTLPMVALVNQGSASGSELLAGALQDRGRAILIGTRTFGKGSVNHLRELSDGSALYVTIGRWLTPNGRQIEGNGLQPDVEVRFTEEDFLARREPPLEYAVQALLAKIKGEPLPPAPVYPAPAPTGSATPAAGSTTPRTNP